MPRIATVFGATGHQGVAVVDALLKDGTFVPRAVTRDPSSPAARELASRGAQVVAADLGDKEAVKKALSGAEVAFGVTLPFRPVPEITQGKNLVDAAKEEGVKFFVFSMSEISKGKYDKAVHFEDKGKIAKYLEESGLPSARVIMGYFLENFMSEVSPITKTAKGYHLSAPYHLKSVFPYIWLAHDLGTVVTTLFKIYPEKLSEIRNVDFDVNHARATLGEIVEEIGKELGQPIEVEYRHTPDLEPLRHMHDFAVEFDIIGGRAVPDPKLSALGLKQDGTIHEFVQTTLKPYLEKQEAK